MEVPVSAVMTIYHLARMQQVKGEWPQHHRRVLQQGDVAKGWSWNINTCVSNVLSLGRIVGTWLWVLTR